MHYIRKTLTNGQGLDNICWIARSGNFNIPSDTATITLMGWLDAASYVAGKSVSDVRCATVKPSLITEYQNLMMEILGKLIGSTGPLAGGTVDEEGSITCDRVATSGHTISYWRSATGEFDLAGDRGSIVLRGWKDKNSYDMGLSQADIASMVLVLSELTTFEAAWTAVATALLVNDDSPFKDGILAEL